jgi:hypothetical protein
MLFREIKMALNCIALTLLLTTLAGGARAQDGLSGTWEGETRSGSSIVLTLAVKGTSLTGTLVRNGESAALADGKVSKNTFSFKATVNDQTEGFSGELAGDELRIWLDRQGADTAIVLRRARHK